MTGTIVKALSGFYYVDVGAERELVTCRGRGKLRHQKIKPLVGDHVDITINADGTGMVDEVLPRTNQFQRPMVANMEQLVILASEAIPVTDPFLIDRMISLAEYKGCEPIICFNKWDLEPADQLVELYRSAGFQTFAISARTGEGLAQLLEVLHGKISAFTGNSGVGKSSVLNALCPQFHLEVGQVSEKLGRGRHTTRHVELFRVGGGLVADTPGFSAFDVEQMELIPKEKLADTFREFRSYLEQCRFVGCAHLKERGCAVRQAVEDGAISPSRYQSYARLYEQVKSRPQWEK
ncbi:MAG TPA: ribosome small subunit-dependent GTPase A [Candidatus Enterenecus avicola]|nr:ribosome small subunit-dependent GTPase A [Candidatus Enterenecus avicola]